MDARDQKNVTKSVRLPILRPLCTWSIFMALWKFPKLKILKYGKKVAGMANTDIQHKIHKNQIFQLSNRHKMISKLTVLQI